MDKEEKVKRKKKPVNKKLVLIIVLSIVTALLIVGVVFGVHIYRILHDPSSFFKPSETITETDNSSDTIIGPAFTIDIETEPDTDPETTAPDDDTTDDNTDTQTETDTVTETEPETEPEPVEPPYEVFNVMLMGIDAYSDGSTSSGTVPHTDVSIVLAINFEKNTIDMISLQRDTFTTIPGYRGFYKFNSVFNVGGGMKNKNGGFELVCRTAEQWLGGITIPYYYAVDFEGVVKIVDKMGGIDYDVDQAYHTEDGRYITKGKQHLDGKAVLGYLRVRREADGLDRSRNTRQRKMLLAIFNKLKKENKISMIPTLLSAAGNHLYTNTTASQTAALVNFAANLDSKNIHSLAMYGTIKFNYEWAYAFVDQQNRIDLIKNVYNIKVKPVGTCTEQYERWLNNVGFDAIKHIRQAEKVLTYVQEQKDKGKTFTEEQIKTYSKCYSVYVRLTNLNSESTSTLTELYTGQRTYEGGEEAAEAHYKALIETAEAELRETTNALKKAVGYSGTLTYTVYKPSFEKDKDINEVYVDFR